MNSDKIKALYELRGSDPQKAIILQEELGNSPKENQVKAIVLIDAGELLSDIGSVSKGVEMLKLLKKNEYFSPENSYNLANGLQVRGRLNHDKVNPHSGSSFEDRFEARQEFGEVMNMSGASSKTKSQASTNIGILLLETGRWVEALYYFKHATAFFPTNSVAAFQEMRYLMGFLHLYLKEEERYSSYSHIDPLVNRIKSLATLISGNYDVIEEFSGPQALETVRKATDDALKLTEVPSPSLTNKYFEFIRENDLALSLYSSFEEYEKGKFDLIRLASVSYGLSNKFEVPEIFAMINIIISDYAFARQVFYEAQYDDNETIFHETSSHSDRLDYALYGVQFSALTTAQRIAFDILDKIAVAIGVYLEIPKASKTDFTKLWGQAKKDKGFVVRPEIEKELQMGNSGLIALYNMFSDISKDQSRGNGFLEAHKRYRNSTTHRFTVLHDETLAEWDSTSNSIEHESIEKFEALTLMSLKLSKAALFYFVDAINFHEDRKPSDKISIASIVPSHDYIRGRK